ncbi:hypothetical protein FHU36_002384 [Nonomuraea muscovyensis]|uniref:Uncharacterized protein n=1 Tax=Nonomuraea muscovyensis TaxID=1124761 RepID=A0A7X0EYK3_9ACTN|nr:hypothetical protein [Nonomuraea muscovyensis]MBB6345875.1 hypothetical protein [Nonomuraea muscovyensis]
MSEGVHAGDADDEQDQKDPPREAAASVYYVFVHPFPVQMPTCPYSR